MEPKHSFFLRMQKGRTTRFLAALLVTGASLALRKALDPVLGSYIPYLTIFPAVIFSAWFCGLWPSVLAVMIAFFGETYWFVEPRHSLTISHTAHLIAASVYVVTAVFIIATAETSRAAMAEARAVHQHLDGLVKKRTAELEAGNADLTAQTEKVRVLSSRLLTLRDEERRNIAREIHDSIGQLAAVIKMNLARMVSESRALSEGAANALTENLSLMDQLIAEVRTISYLLHPPVLDALGLQSALKWFVDGFAQRSKLDVKLIFPDKSRRFSPELETHLFRIAQECLTNIYRHSGGSSAVLRLVVDQHQVRLEVEDNGKGILPEKLRALESKAQLGVGIGGMHERVRQFGGTIGIKSDSRGTVVVALIPLEGSESSCLEIKEPATLHDAEIDSPLSRAAVAGKESHL